VTVIVGDTIPTQLETTNGGMRYNRVLVRYLLAQWMADSSFKQEETESHVLLLIQ